MNKEEAGKLLVLMHHYVPSYQPPKGAAESWQEILGSMSFEEAKQHLLNHFQTSEYLPKPYDILKQRQEKEYFSATDDEIAESFRSKGARS